MTKAVSDHWRGPAWALSLLLAALSMIGPFAIDTYLPAFAAMATELGATAVQMQQTLSAYLFAFAAMNLFHGALSDSLGRRPVVLAGTAVFAIASAGCAMSDDIATLLFFRVLQGASAGAGMTVARAVIRDLFPPSAAQRVMSQVTMFFSLAPAVAPLIGGWLLVTGGWRSIFWFLALVTFAFTIAQARWLPESLPAAARQPLRLKPLLRGYASLLGRRRFVVLVLASSLPFNGYFLYILSAPVFVGELLGVPPTQFFWFFVIGIAGIMGGAWTSGRLAGRIEPARQVVLGITVLCVATLANLAAAWGSGGELVLRFLACTLPLALYAFGWSLIVPVVTIMVLDNTPDRRGMAASLQGAIGSTVNGLVAGVLAPLVMHSLVGLALASAAQMLLGALAWRLAQRLR